MTDKAPGPSAAGSNTVPSQINIPGAAGSSNSPEKHAGRTGRKKSQGQQQQSESGSTGVDPSFKNDSADLGVMYHKYFGCSSPYDQVRFTDTQEQLSIYVGQHYQPFGRQFKAAILDTSLQPSVEDVIMPQKPHPDAPGVICSDGFERKC